MSRAKRGTQGPESYTYDQFKGRNIRIWPTGAKNAGETWEGLLVWVDTYTIGVAFDHNDPDDVSIVYKDAIRIDLM